jgi:single-strand DNA-binding protein
MYETQVTIVGNVVNTIDKRELANGTTVANFRVGSTERRYDRASGGWIDGDRLYVDVTCWRHLAENAAASLVKGDPVVVTGRLFTRNYEHEGQRRTSMTIDANSVAADLSRCRAVVTRTKRSTANESGAADGDRGGQQNVAPSDAVQAHAVANTMPANTIQANTIQANTGPLVDHDAARPAPRLVAAAPAGEA